MARLARSLLAPLGAALVLALGCTREPAFEKTDLVRLPPTWKRGSLLVSDDGQAYAFVDARPAGERVVTRDGTSDPHTLCTRLAFAPRTHRLYYWTVDGDDDASRRVAVVPDGRSIPTDFAGAGAFAFSEDGTHWAAIGAGAAAGGELGDFTLRVDGRDMGRHRDVGTPAFSRDGHAAYLATDGDTTALFVDGTTLRTFPPPTAPCAASAYAHATRPDLPLRHVVRWLSDGGLLVLTRDADGWGVYRDGTRLAAYGINRADLVDESCRTATAIAPASLRVAERTPIAVWWARAAGDAERERLWRVVKDGAPLDDVTCSEPWHRQPPEMSPDGAHLAYACKLRDADNLGTSWVHHDGHRYGPYQEIWGIALSADGRHVTYGATLGGAPSPRPWAIYVDGVPHASDFAATWRPRVSDDGTVVAWQAKRTDDGRGTLGIGSRAIGSFDDVLWGPELEPAAGGRIHVAWVIRRGRTVTRLRVPLPAQHR